MHCIVKFQDRYFDWSTAVDAPISYAMTRGELEHYFGNNYGPDGLRDLAERLERVERTGTSIHGSTGADVLESNRASDDGQKLTESELLAAYAGPVVD